jgi:hypothetical protein
MAEKPTCAICGEPMPEGEEMFKYHGYSGRCPKPPLPRKASPEEARLTRIYDILAGINDKIEFGDDGYVRFGSTSDADRLRSLVQELAPDALAIHDREAQRELRSASAPAAEDIDR